MSMSIEQAQDYAKASCLAVYWVHGPKGMECWTVACGGTEPVTGINGRRYQYMWEMLSGQHAYYCFEDDMYLEYNQLPEELRA